MAEKISPKKIREMADLLKVEPKDIIEKLEKKESQIWRSILEECEECSASVGWVKCRVGRAIAKPT
jgi:hypothetical protein